MARHDAASATRGQTRTTEPDSDPDRRRRAHDRRSRSRSRRWRRPAAALLVALAVGLAAVPIGPAAAASGGADTDAAGAVTATTTATEPSLIVDDATVEPGETATHRLALTDAPDGLAGFELTVELSGDDGTATVANASYPDEYGMTTDPIVSADEQSITVEAVDLGDEVTPGATDVTLATVEVNATDAGSATLDVTDVQIDDDSGDAVVPSIEAGTLTVGDGGNGSQSDGAESDDGADGDGGADAESVPGFAAGAALAVLAALVITLFARR